MIHELCVWHCDICHVIELKDFPDRTQYNIWPPYSCILYQILPPVFLYSVLYLTLMYSCILYHIGPPIFLYSISYLTPFTPVFCFISNLYPMYSSTRSDTWKLPYPSELMNKKPDQKVQWQNIRITIDQLSSENLPFFHNKNAKPSLSARVSYRAKQTIWQSTGLIVDKWGSR